MAAMSKRDADYTPSAARSTLMMLILAAASEPGSENKVPFVAALSLDGDEHPLYIKLSLIPGFTCEAISDWAKINLEPGSTALSDGLACFAAVTRTDCRHGAIIVGGRKPKDMLEFLWLNTILGNLKTSLGGAYHAFGFAK
ncbi:hypothetical protein CEK71_08245 [Methylovulum psychrotolerans]|jgi:hypothetical protein|uniref:ISXO2-like transposase domain-containing protein n=1 Tax=Methylovulum psychrotolerans TaxID=1704499 RepID=A0A1Z4BXU2_9GAMM|nr:hypothetical protein CEK71_08245 [Methylovulum psychrotolerans]